MKKSLLLILSIIFLIGCNNRHYSVNNSFGIIQKTSNRISKHYEDDSVSFEFRVKLYSPIGDSTFSETVGKDLSAFIFDSDKPLLNAWESFRDSFCRDNLDYSYENLVKNHHDGTDLPTWDCEYILDTYVRYGNNGIFNYYINVYSFTGGAHGSTLYACRNYDAKDGHLVLLDDVIKKEDKSFLADILYKNLLDKIGATDSSQLGELGYFSSSEIPVPDNYIIKKDTLSFIYNQYEIAPYSTGVTVLDIPMSDIPSSMKVDINGRQ